MCATCRDSAHLMELTKNRVFKAVSLVSLGSTIEFELCGSFSLEWRSAGVRSQADGEKAPRKNA